VGDDAWCKEEFEEEEDEAEEEEEEAEEEEGEQEDSEDEENPDEEAQEEDSSEKEQEEDEKAEGEPMHPAKKPVRVARAPSPASQRPPSPGVRHQSGADKIALFADPNDNAIARQLLELIDFGPHPPE
jgi:hypothetical protein